MELMGVILVMGVVAQDANKRILRRESQTVSSMAASVTPTSTYAIVLV
jgi:hypothetical protein